MGLKCVGGTQSLIHLMFVDDYLFCRAISNEAKKVKSILNIYEHASGQAINMQKSQIYFSKNTPQEVWDQIGNTFDVN